MYTLTTETYLDNCNYYNNIITINKIPEGPLQKHIRKISFRPLSSFQPSIGQNKCGLAITCLEDKNKLMSPDNIPDLFYFLYNNGYSIESNLTNMMSENRITLNTKKIICFFSFTAKN